ncbi:hypothetical protein HPP92_002001 [Vanilla planifolia]|uniref:ER lumen protein retaining receptor n=1 Tax=Vanilla planifolia TaxID=51239 RepID=A0A835RZ33_VANPL|nr:hypothetical protein HPP92_002001 [Vanilla planifolia]
MGVETVAEGEDGIRLRRLFLAAVVLLGLFFGDQYHVFMGSKAFHAISIFLLVYKLLKDRTCAGLSLKSQELTALFLLVRLHCDREMPYDIQRMLSSASLIATLWVVYMIRVTLKASYMGDKDNFCMHYVVMACALLALLVHPHSKESLVDRILWAFCCYLETVSVMPQLRLMQNTKVVESITAHYVFALAVARFLSCANWILQIVFSRGTILLGLGYGFWPGMFLLSEILQTFIFTDFCYYYLKSIVERHPVLRLPSDAV